MTDAPKARRAPGRPQARSDEETRRVIADAAREVFARSGFMAASMDEVARSAGVSKKTLYRLVPTKAELFKASVVERIERFVLNLDDGALGGLAVEDALDRIMTEYGLLTLSVDTVALQKLVISESDSFPDLASDFYRHAVIATQDVLARYLERQRDAGSLRLDDCREAAGMLRGMLTMEPQRAAMMGVAAPPDAAAITDRARRCVRLFLNGCGAPVPEARSVRQTPRL